MIRRKISNAIDFRLRKLIDKVYCWWLRRQTRNDDFTIISSNCWGGSIYEDLKKEYKTPTVGLFFYAPCYLKFLKNIKEYLSLPIKFIESSKYEVANEMRQKTAYPLGIIDDVEIHFLHYKTTEEAANKWTKRCKRINFSNLFVAFTDRDLCTKDLLKEFEKLPYEKKVVFSAKPDPSLTSLVWLKKYAGNDHVGDIYTDRWGYRKEFNVGKWLNTGKLKNY
jgi:uncharacterized protein (DUF1919 family)